MNEKAPANPEGPANAADIWEDDPVKAEHMAYAENPFREDAHELGKMAARAEVAAQSEEVDQNSDMELDLGTPSSRHAFSMQEAQRQAITVANDAGEKRGHDYDRAELLRQEADAAQAVVEGTGANSQQ